MLTIIPNYGFEKRPMNKRKLAYRLYPHPLAVLDLLNKNPVFQRYVAATFESEQQVSNRFAMYETVNGEVAGLGPIDLLEFGVSKGDSITFWANLNSNPQSRFFGFDSFEGLPETWNEQSKGAFSTSGQLPDLHDHRVKFVKGLFQSTLREFLKTFTPSNPIILHIDSDLYSSALFVLTTLDELLIPGSVVMFDEFYDLRNEFDAWFDYSKAFYRNADGLAFTAGYTQVALKIL